MRNVIYVLLHSNWCFKINKFQYSEKLYIPIYSIRIDDKLHAREISTRAILTSTLKIDETKYNRMLPLCSQLFAFPSNIIQRDVDFFAVSLLIKRYQFKQNIQRIILVPSRFEIRAIIFDSCIMKKCMMVYRLSNYSRE